MSDDQKTIDYLYRKIHSFDTVCFDKCVKDPQKKLGNNEEHCLSNLFILSFFDCMISALVLHLLFLRRLSFKNEACSIKMMNALHFMSNLNRNGGIDRMQPVNEKSSSKFF